MSQCKYRKQNLSWFLLMQPIVDMAEVLAKGFYKILILIPCCMSLKIRFSFHFVFSPVWLKKKKKKL